MTRSGGFGVGLRLCVMMFLQFFIWGAWYVTTNPFMNERGMDASIAWAYTVGPLAGIVAPFFLGLVADRFFATERVLAVMHFLGGLAIIAAPFVAGDSRSAQVLFILVLLIHTLCYFPTLGLVNTLSFHNMTDPEKQFPLVRVFGTIGWIVAGFCVSYLNAERAPAQYWLAGGASILLAAYSLTLPHTPPPAKGKKPSVGEILGVDALQLFRSRSFVVFIVSSFLICIPLSAYYQLAAQFVEASGFKDTARTMTYGQMSEIFFMLVMPLFFVRLGVKWMLLVGMVAWVIRYGLFSAAADGGIAWMVLGGILLHGICYDFFFVTGQIYVDKKAPVQIRGQAQGLLVLITLGLGMLIGAQVAGAIKNSYEHENVTAIYAEGFDLRAEANDLFKRAEDVAVTEPTRAEQLREQGNELWRRSVPILLSAYDWRMIWLIPAIGAAVVMVAFALLFRDRVSRTEAAVADAGAVPEAPPPRDEV